MAVKRGDAAVEELRRRLYQEGTQALPFVTESAGEVSPSPLWDAASASVHPLTDPDAYLLKGGDLVHRPPAEVLGPDATSTDEEVRRYCRAGVDLTMRGGTTSGVVYPLAICEIARTRRIRSVGGASAGAIAASAAAAAELGRHGLGRHGMTLAAPSGGRPSPRPDGGHRFQPGFAGLAETLAWLAQVGRSPAEDGHEQYRLAQLFRPTPDTRPLFRVLVATMRRRWWAMPLLVVTAFGFASGSVTLLVTALVPYVFAVLLTPEQPALTWVWTLALLVALTLALTAVPVAIMNALRLRSRSQARSRNRDADPLAEPVSRPAPASHGVAAPAAFAAAGVLVVLVAGWRLRVRAPDVPVIALVFGLIGAWLALALLLLVTVGVSAWWIIHDAKRAKFGLVAGATRREERYKRRRFQRLTDAFQRLRDVAAGMPEDTEPRGLVEWLADTYDDLAGLPVVPGSDGQVPLLRFGHLWCGRGWTPRPEGSDRVAAVAAATDRTRRLVNLELMATDLVHGVPRRLPVDETVAARPDGAPATLYFRRSDLVGPVDGDGAAHGSQQFPQRVVEAMIGGGQPVGANDDRWPYSTADPSVRIEDLYPFPDPWDLPVVVAVRASMALPGLFQAVRLYTVRETEIVRDDFGRAVQQPDAHHHVEARPGHHARVDHHATVPVSYPSGRPGPSDQANFWVDEVWLSDGGITSNFPIHFFDHPLPAWPTLGVNLGSHPSGFGAQDVWVPQDWQGATPLPTSMPSGVLGFGMRIFDTSRGWSDTLQTFMPAFRSRVAWVRQRCDEGGANLFMPRATIASLALRGELAGARLRRRFGAEDADGHWWARHQWLRLRVTLGNIADLSRDRRRRSDLDYRDLLDRLLLAHGAFEPAGLLGAELPIADPDEPQDWFAPDVGVLGDSGPAFAASGRSLLDALRAATTPGDPIDLTVLERGVPLPAPVLRQTPPA